MTSSIQTATVSNEEYVIAVIVLAFIADPAGRWLYPNAHEYLTHFPHFVRALAGRAFEHNTAYYIDGYSGTALWLPPGIHPDKDRLIAQLQQSVSDQDQAEVFAVFEQMDHYHPSEPHWYLPLLGVELAQQGNGYGSALLQHTLMQCDRDQKLAYLESTNATNLPLYKRHGFELLGTIQLGTSPAIFPMLRHPR
ncbi:GNAT family N-acetyltransferase [aff. Roholtiella sp. LEGE 12411]|uniref:GNAT family N-acetyltransferase n=1 Tax=aff. Roholtiella sp. LEGE 12411 TaxID=1828822 RepID=UPI0018807AC0|nr:GNAT family N-acetyltransferase [aff. Roholtiella sp. LEGE 12411]MBE9036109.1 GNAT family N-acetyltransferase [aff. Roholtiella sp. LEGE 12411]